MATATANPGDPVTWAASIAVALLPFAFLAGLLRSHVAHLDAELLARLEELRASRARLVQAGDAERRRLERDLHDGAQSRLVGIAALLVQARKRVDSDAEATSILERAQSELQTSLGELRELARGIHPAVLTERGLDPLLRALAARASVPVTIETHGAEQLPGSVEIAAYYVAAEGLTNVAKYAQASEATVAVRRSDGLVTVDISDDGVGGADAGRGSGLRGLADRVAALDGTLSVDSPAGRGTRLHVEIPLRAAPLSRVGRSSGRQRRMRILGLLISVGRFLFGVVFISKPQLTERAWIGKQGAFPARSCSRAASAHATSVGLGGIQALAQGDGSSARPWLAAGAVCDVVDLAPRSPPAPASPVTPAGP